MVRIWSTPGPLDDFRLAKIGQFGPIDAKSPVALSTDGKFLLYPTAPGFPLALHDLGTSEHRSEDGSATPLPSGPSSVAAAGFVDGAAYVVGSDNMLYVWPFADLKPHTRQLTARLATKPVGRWPVLGYVLADGTLEVWNAESDILLLRRDDASPGVSGAPQMYEQRPGLTLSTNSDLVAYVTATGIRVEALSGKTLCLVPGAVQPSFTPDAQYLTLERKGYAERWQTQSCHNVWRSNTSSPYGLDFSVPQDKRYVLVIAQGHGLVHLLAAETGSELATENADALHFPGATWLANGPWFMIAGQFSMSVASARSRHTLVSAESPGRIVANAGAVARVAVDNRGQLEVYTLDPTLFAGSEVLRDRLCKITLKNDLSLFRPDEFEIATMIDSKVFHDACRPPTLLERARSALSL